MARRSALAGAHPASGHQPEPEQADVQSPPEQPEREEQPERDEGDEAMNSQSVSTAGGSAEPGGSGRSGEARTTRTGSMGRRGRSAKTTLTVDPDTLDEAKDGYWVALAHGRHRTFAEYVTAALEAYNQTMRETYTGGAEFPARPSGNLPTTQVS